MAEGATHVAHSHNIRRAAFTLAEVLITLGIIGVVAAMTIPTLVNKYQMKVFETAFKKQYSVFQNALDYQYLENGLTKCYWWFPGIQSYEAVTHDCSQLEENLVSYMKLTETDNSVIKEYKIAQEVLSDGGFVMNNSFVYDSNLLNAAYYFSPDGTIFIFSHHSPVIILDVNGQKGPNKWGYDVFYMILSNHNGQYDRIFLTDELATLVEKGGRLPRDILLNKQRTNFDDIDWSNSIWAVGSAAK